MKFTIGFINTLDYLRRVEANLQIPEPKSTSPLTQPNHPIPITKQPTNPIKHPTKTKTPHPLNLTNKIHPKNQLTPTTNKIYIKITL
jgi:hypothetical protein